MKKSYLICLIILSGYLSFMSRSYADYGEQCAEKGGMYQYSCQCADGSFINPYVETCKIGYDLKIKEEVLKSVELVDFLLSTMRRSFGVSPFYYIGEPGSSSKSFLAMVNDLGKLVNRENLSNQSLVRRVFENLAKAYLSVGRREGQLFQIDEYIELLFDGKIKPTVGPGLDYRTREILSALVSAVEDKSGVFDDSDRMAAQKIIDDLVNPSTKELIKNIIKEKSASSI